MVPLLPSASPATYGVSTLSAFEAMAKSNAAAIPEFIGSWSLPVYLPPDQQPAMEAPYGYGSYGEFGAAAGGGGGYSAD